MKVCSYCAEELADDVVLCTQCGRDTTVEPGWSTSSSPARSPSAEEIVRSASREEPAGTGGVFGRSGMNRLAIASFIVVMAVAILGTAARFPPAGAVVAYAVGLGLGVKAMRDTRSAPAGGSGFGFAVAAVVLSVLGLIGYGRLLI